MMAQTLYMSVHPWQTRILEVFPAEFGKPLTANLHVVDIPDGPGLALHRPQQQISFYALSYCWGDPVFNHDIVVNGVQCKITANLYAALQRVRQRATWVNSGMVFYIWADALCINQEDLEERSQQVKLMLSIYAKAETVLIWLGEEQTGMSMTLNDIAEVTSANRTNVSLRNQYRRALAQIARNPWFQRIWVKQEVWAAREALAMLGDSAISSEKLREALQRVGTASAYEKSNDDPHLSSSRALIRTAAAGLVQAGEHKKVAASMGDVNDRGGPPSEHDELEITNVLGRFAGGQCSDSRDHIYGLLGMSKTTTANPALPRKATLHIDYTKTVPEVFQDLAEYVIKRDESLWLLFLIGQFGGAIDGRSLPTWVPDWRHKTSRKPWMTDVQDWGDNLGFNPPWRSCLSMFKYTAPLLTEQSCRKFLRIRGMRLGTVEQLLGKHTSRMPDRPARSKGSSFVETRAESICEIVFATLRSAHVFQSSLERLSNFRLWLQDYICTETSSTGNSYLLPLRYGILACDFPESWVDYPWACTNSIRQGDVVFVAYGAMHPLVVRSCGDSPDFEYVGPTTVTTDVKIEDSNIVHPCVAHLREKDKETNLRRELYESLGMMLKYAEIHPEILETVSLV